MTSRWEDLEVKEIKYDIYKNAAKTPSSIGF